MSPIPINVSTSLTTLPLNSLTHEQKFNTSASTPLYSLISSFPNNKQKGNGFGHPNGYNQSGIGQFDRFDQFNIQNQDSFTCDNWLNFYQLLYDSNSTNPLRDPNFSSTLLYGDQTLSSNPSSISTSLDDDNSLFDIPSKTLHQLNHQDPFSPLLSLSSYPQTPTDYVDSSACLQSVVSSPTSSDNNSVVVSPDQRTNISNSPNINTRRSSSTLSLQNTSYGSINNTSKSGSSNNDANQQKCSMSSNQQTSYGSINNNSRQRSISSPSSDTHSHVTTQQRRPSSSINLSATSHQLSFDNAKIEQGSIDTNKTLSIAQRCSPTSKLITNQSVSPTISNRHSYGSLSFLQTSIASNIDSNSASQPRRSSTSTITSSQSAEQYRSRSLNMPNLGQGNITSSGSNVRPTSHLRRSSTSNLTPARTTAQAYSSLNISIDKSAYMPSVTTAQYSVDGYQIVGHVSSGENSSGAVTPFSAKYHPIQPKAGKLDL
jgi:hypothetical protein